MAQRVITGQLLDADGTVWDQGGTVLFKLANGAYSVAGHVPPDTERARVSDTGAFSITVFAPARYTVTLPGDYSFEVNVPEGDPTTLELLHADTGP